MANYAPSTRERIADLVAGMRLETAIFDANTYFDNGSTTTGQYELFQVYGRILLMHLYIEITTVLGAGAAVISFTYTSSSPAIGVQEICDACASVAALPEGCRIVWPGGIIATLATITVATTGGVSDYTPPGNPHYIGTQGGTGTIGMLTATAQSASGAAQAFMNYVPMEVGAYVVANAAPAAP